MSFRDFLHTSREWVDEEGVVGLKYCVNQAWMGILRRMNPFFKEGTNVFEKDWDLLIILDACRVDALEKVADEYAFLDQPGTMRSVASTSIEWMEETFTEDHKPLIEDTVYVTANQHSSAVVDQPFEQFENLYDYGWDSDLGTVSADVVTDKAIEIGRENDEYDRMIIHYMQPHFPSIPEPLGHGNKFDNVWKGLMVGQRDEDEVWESYIANLRYVLDHVAVLLENINAETVALSADHGNGKGEWGVYEHPIGVPTRQVRTVPWYVTTASDTQDYTVDADRQTGLSSTSREERLKSLGYL